MAVEVYLGNPPAHIVQWIKDHSGPAPRAVTRIWWSDDESDFSDCHSNNGIFDDTCFPTGKSNTDAVKVEFGSDVTSIGEWVFASCYYLTSVMIGNGVTSIGTGAFDSCLSLKTVTIPGSVTSIGEGVFISCGNLTSVTFLGKTREQVQNIEDGNGNKYYPWGIEDTDIIHVSA